MGPAREAADQVRLLLAGERPGERPRAAENSQRSISIETLMRICDALDIEICLRDRQTPRPVLTAADMHRSHASERRHE